MNPRTILFFPWSHGVGFGYIGRALAIAAELREAGHLCVFACDTAENLVRRSGFEVCAGEQRHSTAVPDMGRRQGQYISIDNLDTAFAIAGYYHARRVREDVRTDLAAIDAVRPDLVSIDMQPTAAIAARARGVPLVSVGDSDFYRPTDNSWMPWVPKEGLVNPYPSCVPAFNAVIGELGGTPIASVCDVLRGDLTLVASTPELEAGQPALPGWPELEFVGPVFWDPPWSEVAGTLATHGETAQRRIYITLGHGGKTTDQQLAPILQACDNPDWAVFVSLGFRTGGDIALPANTVAGGFTGITAPIRWADLVIDHGGYTTVLTSLLHGKPSIVIPFMSEQEANGILFVEGNDAGFVLRKTRRTPGGPRHFVHDLRYSGESPDGHYTAHEWRQAVDEVFTDPRYLAGARAASEALRSRIAGRSFAETIGRFAARHGTTQEEGR